MENIRDMTGVEKDAIYLPEFGTMRIMDLEAGDIEVKWNRCNKDETDAAREAYNKAKQKGFVFYKGKKDDEGGVSQGKIMDGFDEKAEIIIGRPMVQGG
jgi:hypothetical protein